MTSLQCMGAAPTAVRVRAEAGGAGSRGVRPCDTLLRGEPADQHQGCLPAGRTGQAGSWWLLGRVRFGPLARRQQELEPPQRVAVRGVERPRARDPVQALEGHVLEEAAQELVGGEVHGLAPLISAVSVAEGHRAIVGGDDGLVRDRGLVDVATEVLEDLLRAWTTGLAKTIQLLPHGMSGNATPGRARRARWRKRPRKSLASAFTGTR